jgi:hypothetical protein
MLTRTAGLSAVYASLWLSSALLGVRVSSAQTRPTEACKFAGDGFATSLNQNVQIAEVRGRFRTQLEECDSPKGCIGAPVAQGTPVQIYRREGAWTCGYVSGRDGAGPAWIRTDALSIVHYSDHPSLSAWTGRWAGDEDHVSIRLADMPGALHLAGSAVWHGGYTSHLGDTKGMATPIANHLHFVEGGPGSCSIDLTLLNRYILAEDNQACGGLNARFQGIWKRIGR